MPTLKRKSDWKLIKLRKKKPVKKNKRAYT